MLCRAAASTFVLLGVVACSSASSPDAGPGRGASAFPAESAAVTTDAPVEATLVARRGKARDATVTRTNSGIVPMHVSLIGGGSGVRVTVWGSSSCPAVGEGAQANATGTVVTVTPRSYGGKPCTADVSPATTVVTFAPEFRLAERVEVVYDTPRNRLTLRAE